MAFKFFNLRLTSLLIFNLLSLFYSNKIHAQSELNFEKVVNITRVNTGCYYGVTPVYDTVPTGKIWKLEAIIASCPGPRRPLVTLNGTLTSLNFNNTGTSMGTYLGNPIWLKENTIIGSTSDNPGAGSGCFDCTYFYSILEFSQNP
jgi:hypothetical protein